MSWTLGSTTLPDPRGFKRKFVEKSTYHEMINGTSKKDISNRKERFEMYFTRLSQAVVASILAEFSLKQALSFSVDDGDLMIAATDVHVDISGRDYNTKGSEYREDVTVVLTEVS
jgi:hypothetical protein